MRLAFLFVPMLLAGGCTTPLHEQVAALSRAAPCCSGFHEFKYQALSLPSENTVELSSDAPAFVFKHGKSFFAAYVLPPFVGPYTLSISHQPVATAISPLISLLDANFAVSREFDRSIARTGAGYRQILDIFVNSENQHEKYLVISARTAGEKPLLTKTFTPVIVPIGAAAIVVNGSEKTSQTVFGPIGNLNLNLTPYLPTVVGNPSP